MPSNKMPKRFLSSEELERGAREVVALARGERISVALLGGYAMALYGSDRLTADLDFAASAPLSGFRPEKALGFGGYSSRLPNGTPVDIILRDDEYRGLYEEAIERAECIEGLPVVSVPYLMAMKMASGRGKDEVDLRWLMATYDEPEILDEARKVIRRHLGIYALKEFDAELSLARWEREREQ